MRSVALMASLLAICLLGVSISHASDKSGVLKASHLIGMKVKGTDDKQLGTIKDLVIDPDGGFIVYAVLDFGGFAGIGDKYFAVPWDALELTGDFKLLVLEVNKRDLKDAPGFDKNNWPDFTDRQQTNSIYEYYGIPTPEEENLNQRGKKR